MPSYTKLFESLVTSTIWTESNETRIVWITLMAMADKNGEVFASIPGLARVAGVSVEDCAAAIKKFLEPDPYSRSQESDGRRIEEIPGGWELINHAKYRALASKEDSKKATAERVRRHRQRNANVTQCNANVTQCNANVTVGRDIAEAEAEAETENKGSTSKEKSTSLPITPQSGERESPNSKKSRLPTNPTAIRIGALFRRKPTTAWSDKEIRAFKAIGAVSEDDLAMIERYYAAERSKGDDGRHRRDLLTFLNNYAGEIDRATAHAEKTQPSAQPERKFQFTD